MYGRRYNQGLHQAIEAKEHVKVEKESKTYASITLQNYFRMYAKLSGMTGTAMTEEDEFRHIYSLDVVEIPTNKPNIRRDYQDSVFKTEPSKFNAVIEQICGVPSKRVSRCWSVQSQSKRASCCQSFIKARHKASGAQRQASRKRRRP